MKNIIAFLLGLILTLGVLFISLDSPLFTTDPTSVPTTIPTTPATNPDLPSPHPTVPTVSELDIPELPMSAIVLTEQMEFSENDNIGVYFTYCYPNVRLYLHNEAISTAVTLDLLNRIDATRATADALRDDAHSVADPSSFYRVQYLPQRIDSSILSLSVSATSFAGSAHPISICTGVTYDLMTGYALSLDDILTDAATADVLCRLVVDALASINHDGLLYEDFSVSVEERFSGNFLDDQSWHLSNDGLCFSFEPYEVGPYSSGTIVATIPYGQLPGYLEDAWFPMEQISAPGNVIIEKLDNDTQDPYADVVEIHMDTDGASLILHTDGLLYNVTIHTSGPNPMVLFAADQLTPSGAIVLYGATHGLQITYTRDGETITQSISAS